MSDAVRVIRVLSADPKEPRDCESCRGDAEATMEVITPFSDIHLCFRCAVYLRAAIAAFIEEGVETFPCLEPPANT